MAAVFGNSFSDPDRHLYTFLKYPKSKYIITHFVLTHFLGSDETESNYKVSTQF